MIESHERYSYISLFFFLSHQEPFLIPLNPPFSCTCLNRIIINQITITEYSGNFKVLDLPFPLNPLIDKLYTKQYFCIDFKNQAGLQSLIIREHEAKEFDLKNE